MDRHEQAAARAEVTGAEHDLATLFAPRSVAVIGASGRPGALSWWPLHLLDRYGFKGEVYPVNPSRDAIDGRVCYPTLADGARTGRRRGDRAQRRADARGAGRVRGGRRARGGPADAGHRRGRLRRRRAAAARWSTLARARGLRIAGPNTDGVARFATGAVASIQPVLGQDIQPGPVAVVTQSGATAASLVRRLQREGLGCGLYASTGNEADLGLEDYLSYALQDPEIRIVLSFVESIRRPADFRAVCDLAREVGKPIALIKVGRSEVGARRAAAHTGALAGADAVYDAVFRARGVIRVAELSELVAVAKLHLAIGAPASTGIGIISVSGRAGRRARGRGRDARLAAAGAATCAGGAAQRPADVRPGLQPLRRDGRDRDQPRAGGRPLRRVRARRRASTRWSTRARS